MVDGWGGMSLWKLTAGSGPTFVLPGRRCRGNDGHTIRPNFFIGASWDIGVGAQSTLGGAQNFCPKNVLKISKMPEIYMILARKIIKIPEFL